jgi:hypothetical protein
MTGLAFPKPGDTPSRARKKRKGQAQREAAKDKARVFARSYGACVGVHVSPVCQRVAVHPHEIVPVGAGGRRISRNRVGICAACHREVQGRVGGNRLIIRWPGDTDGVPVNADLGNVWCEWRERP